MGRLVWTVYFEGMLYDLMSDFELSQILASNMFANVIYNPKTCLVEIF